MIRAYRQGGAVYLDAQGRGNKAPLKLTSAEARRLAAELLEASIDDPGYQRAREKAAIGIDVLSKGADLLESLRKIAG